MASYSKQLTETLTLTENNYFWDNMTLTWDDYEKDWDYYNIGNPTIILFKLLTFVDSFSFSEVFSKLRTSFKVFSEKIILTETFNKVATLLRVLAEEITLTEQKITQIIKNFIESLSFSETINTIFKKNLFVKAYILNKTHKGKIKQPVIKASIKK